MDNFTRKMEADRILYEFGLMEQLEKIGVPHIIGSYRMDMMAWNDLDIDIENDNMSMEKLYELSSNIIKTFHPVWYEAKEEISECGKKIWFHGFETTIIGELWNIDLWFFDKETIRNAEIYCDGIVEKTDGIQKNIIVMIKEELIKRGVYSFEQYRSIDVYEAVTKENVRNTEEFLSLYES